MFEPIIGIERHEGCESSDFSQLFWSLCSLLFYHCSTECVYYVEPTLQLSIHCSFMGSFFSFQKGLISSSWIYLPPIKTSFLLEIIWEEDLLQSSAHSLKERGWKEWNSRVWAQKGKLHSLFWEGQVQPLGPATKDMGAYLFLISKNCFLFNIKMKCSCIIFEGTVTAKSSFSWIHYKYILIKLMFWHM